MNAMVKRVTLSLLGVTSKETLSSAERHANMVTHNKVHGPLLVLVKLLELFLVCFETTICRRACTLGSMRCRIREVGIKARIKMIFCSGANYICICCVLYEWMQWIFPY